MSSVASVAPVKGFTVGSANNRTFQYSKRGWEMVVTAVIKRNLNSISTCLTILGEIQYRDRKPKLSYRSVCTEALRLTCREQFITKKCWEIAALAGLAGLGCCVIGITYLFKKKPILSYGQVQRGILAVYGCRVCVSFFSVFKRILLQDQHKYTVVQLLLEKPCFCHELGTLSNTQTVDGKWMDAISNEAIDNIKAPYILVIKNRPSHIANVLRQIFAADLKDEMIQYSILELTPNERLKVADEICTFFCLKQEDFLDCWNVTIDKECLPETLKQDFHSDWHVDKLRTIARIMKLLALLPGEVITPEFSKALLKDDLPTCNLICTNPIVQCQVMGSLPLLRVPYLVGLYSVQR